MPVTFVTRKEIVSTTLASVPVMGLPLPTPMMYVTTEPAVIVIGLYGEGGTGPLLILSQVILSLQLPFAVFPLVRFTSDRAKMGAFANPAWVKALAWSVAIVIAALNVWLLAQTFAAL